MNSIQVRLLSGICLCLLAVFAVSGFLLYVYLHQVLQSSFDAALLERANFLAKTTEFGENGILEFEFLEANLSEYWPHDKAEYFQVWQNTGEMVGRSPSLGLRDLPVELPLRGDPLFRNIELPDGRAGRVVMLNFIPQATGSQPVGQYTLAIATSRKELDKALFLVIKGLFLAGLTLVLGAFPAVWWSVRRALLSLQSLGEQANTIGADNLSFRFPVAGSPHELRPICGRLNNLLERIEAAFNRERRFTADAAHELRTPIAELRTLAEVGLQDTNNNAPEMREYFEDAVSIAQHLERLVTTLLALTRCDAGLQKVELNPVEMAAVTRSVWESYEQQARGHDMAVTLDIADRAPILTDEGLLRAMLANIFSNAVSYTPCGGAIHVALQHNANSTVLIVDNSCGALREQDLVHLFEPFWRKDQGRSNSEHCGVGLSLVAGYAQILGMTVKASMPREGVFQISLRSLSPVASLH